MPSPLIQQDNSQSWWQVIRTEIRFLTFRATREELAQLGTKHLIFGILCTWLVGIGRYWDNPRVGLLQHLGTGSVIYLFVFSLLLWLVLWPLRPKGCSYFKVLTFVSMVSPPALLYAIPVEHFFSIDTANTINVWFLAIVATWRVALLIFFLKRYGQMNPFVIIIATLLPLTFIVLSLTILNLEKVVFNIMGGIHERSAADSSYVVLLLLSYGSIMLFVPVVIGYVALSILSLLQARKARQITNDGTHHQ